MKAFCLKTGRRIAPFNEPIGETMVDGQTLAEVQVGALQAAGCTVVDEPPEGEPYLLYSDRTWFTSEAIRRLIAAGKGQFRASDDVWFEWSGAQQQTAAPGIYELAVVQGPPTFDACEPVDIDMSLHDMDLNIRHKAFQHAVDTLVRVGPAMVHQMDHWVHIVRVNQLVLIARAEDARWEWASSGFLGRLRMVLRLLWQVRSLNRWRIPRRLCEIGKDVSIHPTAVVEFSRIGDGCEIGPHAVVRGSMLAPGVKVDSHGIVNASVLGTGAQVGRYGHVSLCSLYPGAMVSTGGGFQCCVFGRDSFMAWGSTILDLSFGSSIKVESGGPGTARVDSKQYFLGSAIGHDAKIGNGVKIGYGVTVPNQAVLVDGGEMLRDWGDAPTDEAVVIRNGVAQSRR